MAPSGGLLRLELEVTGRAIYVPGHLVVSGDGTMIALGLTLVPEPLPPGATVTLPDAAWAFFDSVRYRYRLELPATWTTEALADAELYFGPGSQEFSVRAVRDAGTLDGFVDAQRAHYEALLQATPSQVAATMVGGEPARLITYHLAGTFRAASGEVFRPVMYFVIAVHEGNGYGIQWFGRDSEAEAGLEALEQILADFAFTS